MVRQLDEANLFPEVHKLEQQMSQVWQHLQLHDKEVDKPLISPDKAGRLYRMRIDMMLANPAVHVWFSHAGPKQKELHKRLKPMNFNLIQEYTKKVDTAFNVVDGKVAKYSEWKNLQGYHRVGM